MTNDNFSITDGVLRIAGQAVNTEPAVVQAIQAGDNVIVRFEVPHGVVVNDNVACYDQHAHLLWKIQPSPHGGTEDNPYVSIEAADDGRVIAQNWNGVEYQINVDNGTVSAIGLRRF